MYSNEHAADLLISCPDRPGIMSALTNFLTDHGANIVQFDQNTTDPSAGMLFMRVSFELIDSHVTYEQVKQDFPGLAHEYGMNWELNAKKTRKRMAIFVSKEGHCLIELLLRWQSGELPVDIPMVISNHDDLRHEVERFGIPYYHIPVSSETKVQAEKEALALMEGKVDFIALARYMQILTPEFVACYSNQIINIHHSFLPAFTGANPYVKAFNRGVKLIGATAHYVTSDLDEGPIIEQDVQRVNHRSTADDLKISGRHVEKQVLATAVAWHVDNKVLVHGNKTILFV